MIVSHSGIEPTITGSIVFFITAKYFLLAVTHFLCQIFQDSKSLSLVVQVASASFVSLTGTIGSVGHGEVTESIKMPKRGAG